MKQITGDKKVDAMLNACTLLVSSMDKATNAALPQKIADVVKFHAKGAAIAGLGAGWIPGVGGGVALAATVGFVWTMYIRINNLLEMSLSKNVVKTLASGVATNLAAAAVVNLASSAVLSFIPGVGSIGASAIIGITSYAMLLTSGYIYIKILTRIFKAGKDPTTLSSEELSAVAKETIENEDIKGLMKEAKKEYQRAKESGELENWKDIKVDLEKDE